MSNKVLYSKSNKEMELLIFKTDLKTKKRIKQVKSLFKQIPAISCWNVDRQDVDNVLRIEISGFLNPNTVIEMMKSKGLFCELLS